MSVKSTRDLWEIHKSLCNKIKLIQNKNWSQDATFSDNE